MRSRDLVRIALILMLQNAFLGLQAPARVQDSKEIKFIDVVNSYTLSRTKTTTRRRNEDLDEMSVCQLSHRS